MKLILPAIAGLLIAASAPAAFAAGLDEAVLDELNFVRAHPADYARELRDSDDRSGMAYEDPQAVDDAIAFLDRQDPLPPLRLDGRLSASAMAHTVSQGPRGQVGHDGIGGGFNQRLKQHGVWAGLAAEDISYGYATPREIVRQLVVDSGVANRGHRLNIFGRAFQVAGVSCGDHSLYGAMCVIDFAGAMVER